VTNTLVSTVIYIAEISQPQLYLQYWYTDSTQSC